ncbi:hypothetical protein niasHS_003769 [Heterodera schachtii]|uniref:Uncharacterized protein n=2 Tax=Heterodera TaxID=34509 RepID=A0ABD2K687_HETSC
MPGGGLLRGQIVFPAAAGSSNGTAGKGKATLFKPLGFTPPGKNPRHGRPSRHTNIKNAFHQLSCLHTHLMGQQQKGETEKGGEKVPNYSRLWLQIVFIWERVIFSH